MQPWNELQASLSNLAGRYNQLSAKFSEFANLVKALVEVQTFNVKGIAVDLRLAESYFTTTFLGLTIRYVFSVSMESGKTVGVVRAYRVTTFPTVTATEITSFTFAPSGQCSLIDPSENNPLCITYDLAAVYIALHVIKSGLQNDLS